MTYDPGEGPVDPNEAHDRAHKEHGKPEHAAKADDARDKGIEADLDKHQEKDK